MFALGNGFLFQLGPQRRFSLRAEPKGERGCPAVPDPLPISDHKTSPWCKQDSSRQPLSRSGFFALLRNPQGVKPCGRLELILGSGLPNVLWVCSAVAGVCAEWQNASFEPSAAVLNTGYKGLFLTFGGWIFFFCLCSREFRRKLPVPWRQNKGFFK